MARIGFACAGAALLLTLVFLLVPTTIAQGPGEVSYIGDTKFGFESRSFRQNESGSIDFFYYNIGNSTIRVYGIGIHFSYLEPQEYFFRDYTKDPVELVASDLGAAKIFFDIEPSAPLGPCTYHISVQFEVEISDGNWEGWEWQSPNKTGFEILESDRDGDGTVDSLDDLPDDASETKDTDGDGVGDKKDIFPFDRNETLDSDQDGVGNKADDYPFDATRWKFEPPEEEKKGYTTTFWVAVIMVCLAMFFMFLMVIALFFNRKKDDKARRDYIENLRWEQWRYGGDRRRGKGKLRSPTAPRSSGSKLPDKTRKKKVKGKQGKGTAGKKKSKK